MIHQVLAVFDEKAEAFAQPYFVANEVVGMRAFKAACEDRDSLLFKFPEDYRLYQLGTYDDVTGRLECPDRPRLLMSAFSIREPELHDAAVAQALS